MRKTLKSIILSFILFSFTILNVDIVNAANYTYTVSFFSGNPGTFSNMSGFQVTRGEFLNAHNSPTILISYNKIKFSIECLRKFSKTQYIEILIHPTEKKLAIRPTTKDNRNAVKWANVLDNVYTPRDIAAGAFYQTLTSLMGWSQSIKYKIVPAVNSGNVIPATFL